MKSVACVLTKPPVCQFTLLFAGGNDSFHRRGDFRSCCVNTVQEVDVAQQVDKLHFSVYEYTAAPPEAIPDETRVQMLLSEVRRVELGSLIQFAIQEENR
jgi:hypothetical protein